MDNEALSNSIKRICKDNNITVSQLEKELNISAGLISRWSKTSPSLDKIVDIADYFYISIDELIGREIKKMDTTKNSVISFVDTLYLKTQSKELRWDVYDKNHSLKYKLENFVTYSGWNREYYYTKYKDSFFILHVMYLESKYEITDVDIRLYIQPEEDETPSLQCEGEIELGDLWNCLRSQFYGTLYETKADSIRESFVREGNAYAYESINEMQIDELLKSKSLNSLLSIINTTEFKQIQKIFSDPETIKNLDRVKHLALYRDSFNNNTNQEIVIPDIKKDTGCYMYDNIGRILYQNQYSGTTSKAREFYKKHKDELGEIEYAQMFNGRVLVFKSENGNIMKLSGFTSGSLSGATGLNGTLDTMRDAGFNVDYAFLINHENFKISKDFKIEE